MSSEMKMRLATDLEINLWHDDVMLSKLAQQATRRGTTAVAHAYVCVNVHIEGIRVAILRNAMKIDCNTNC